MTLILPDLQWFIITFLLIYSVTMTLMYYREKNR